MDLLLPTCEFALNFTYSTSTGINFMMKKCMALLLDVSTLGLIYKDKRLFW